MRPSFETLGAKPAELLRMTALLLRGAVFVGRAKFVAGAEHVAILRDAPFGRSSGRRRCLLRGLKFVPGAQRDAVLLQRVAAGVGGEGAGRLLDILMASPRVLGRAGPMRMCIAFIVEWATTCSAVPTRRIKLRTNYQMSQSTTALV